MWSGSSSGTTRAQLPRRTAICRPGYLTTQAHGVSPAPLIKVVQVQGALLLLFLKIHFNKTELFPLYLTFLTLSLSLLMLAQFISHSFIKTSHSTHTLPTSFFIHVTLHLIPIRGFAYLTPAKGRLWLVRKGQTHQTHELPFPV